MIDPLFFVFISISILSYGIQGPLNVYFARRRSPLVFATLRNLSLGVTMLPVLFFVQIEEIAEVLNVLPTLFAACFIGIAGFLCGLTAGRYLPVGVSHALRQSLYVIGAVALGAIVFREYLGIPQLLIMAAILAGSVTLMILKSSHAHLDDADRRKGVFFGVLAGIGYAFSFFFFSILSRELNPLVASYFWEVVIGVFALVYLLCKPKNPSEPKDPPLSLKEVGIIALISMTTISGTVGNSFAVNYGPYALAAGLGTSTVLISTLAGWLFFKERLRFIQIGIIAGVVALIFLLRVIS